MAVLSLGNAGARSFARKNEIEDVLKPRYEANVMEIMEVVIATGCKKIEMRPLNQIYQLVTWL